MNRVELVRKVAAVMRDNDIRKPITSQKQVFHISDDEGNEKDFVIKKSDKGVLYTIEDIDAVLGSIIAVVEDSLKQGDNISIRGFGTLGLHHRKARTTKHPTTGEDVDVIERYVPKFTFGNDLRLCAKMFELYLDESKMNIEPEPVYDEYDEDEGGEQ